MGEPLTRSALCRNRDGECSAVDAVEVSESLARSVVDTVEVSEPLPRSAVDAMEVSEPLLRSAVKIVKVREPLVHCSAKMKSIVVFGRNSGVKGPLCGQGCLQVCTTRLLEEV